MMDGKLSLEMETRKCIACDTTFKVLTTSLQSYHSIECQALNGPADRSWGAQFRKDRRKKKPQKKPHYTHNEYGKLA